MSLHVPRTMLSTTSVRDVCFHGACMSLHVPTHYVVHNLGARRVLFWSLHEPTCASALCCPQPRCETCVFRSLHEPTCANALCCPQPRCETCVVLELHEPTCASALCCPQPRCETCVFRSLHEPTCANALCCPQPRCETCGFWSSKATHVRTEVVDNIVRWHM